MKPRAFLCALAVIVFFGMVDRTLATITVSNTNDSGAGSLRQAIIDNNNAGGGNTIVFAGGVTGTITLTSGHLQITKDTTITGPGARLLAVSGNNASRIFFISAAVNVQISGLSIINGAITSSGGAGVYAQGAQLTLTNCTIANNNAGALLGGGVYGIGSNTTLVLIGCTVSGNQGDQGGGINSAGPLTLTNCTIANNTANTGGGVINFKALTMTSCTIAGNVATNSPGHEAGGIYVGGSPATITNSIIANNTAPQHPDVGQNSGPQSGGYNLIGDGSGLPVGFAKPSDQIGVAANIAALHNNGGPTDTIMPLPTSPAIDHGIASGLGTDQRGFSRPVDQSPGPFPNGGDGSDIGAAEVQPIQPAPNFTVTTNDEHSNGFCEAVNCSLWDAATAADNNTNNNSVITFASGVTGTINVTIQPSGMSLTRPMQLTGPGARVLTLNGGGVGRIFNVSGQGITVSGLKITFGLLRGGSGGAIVNSGGLTLQDCEIDNNAVFATNSFSPNGGAIQNQSGANLTLTRCTFFFNSAATLGGAIHNAGTLTVTNSTFVSNSAGTGGGGISNFGTASFLNCTVTSNMASGAIGDEGGGIRGGSGSSTSLANTIVAGNTSGSGTTRDLDGSFTSLDYNLIGTTTGSSISLGPHDRFGNNTSVINAKFAGYGNNGGPTDTDALAADSPAVDAGNPNNSPSSDERGFPRAGVPDIGAFEFGATAPTPTPTPPATAQALNISTRLLAQTGNNVLIAGFIVSGSDQKTVAVRGIGPSLSQFFSGTLIDPTLELHSGNTTLATNDNWQDDPAQAGQLSAHNLAPTDPRESGIVATLQPGAYTAILAGKNDGTGIGVVEVYDLNQSANSQLANISSRGFVLTDNNVMIGGFILGGGASNTRVAVRGIGPSLAQFGLNPVLADPTLELHNGNGATIATDDDWQDDPAQAALLTANGLNPSDAKEAAIFTSLPPGQFTAILAGKNGGTGIGVVEVFNVH